MDMWLCLKQAIIVAERAKNMYEDDGSKVSAAGKALQDHANLVKDKKASKWQVKTAKEKLAEMRVNLDAVVQVAREAEAVEQAVQVMLEESERSRAAEVEASMKEAVTLY